MGRSNKVTIKIPEDHLLLCPCDFGRAHLRCDHPACEACVVFVAELQVEGHNLCRACAHAVEVHGAPLVSAAAWKCACQAPPEDVQDAARQEAREARRRLAARKAGRE